MLCQIIEKIECSQIFKFLANCGFQNMRSKKAIKNVTIPPSSFPLTSRKPSFSISETSVPFVERNEAFPTFFRSKREFRFLELRRRCRNDAVFYMRPDFCTRRDMRQLEFLFKTLYQNGIFFLIIFNTEFFYTTFLTQNF